MLDAAPTFYTAVPMENTEVVISCIAMIDNSTYISFVNNASDLAETLHIKLESYQVLLFDVKCYVCRIDINASIAIAASHVQDDGMSLHPVYQLLPVSRWGDVSFPVSEDKESVEVTGTVKGL